LYLLVMGYIPLKSRPVYLYSKVELHGTEICLLVEINVNLLNQNLLPS
jgi:hypothetical protein